MPFGILAWSLLFLGTAVVGLVSVIHGHPGPGAKTGAIIVAAVFIWAGSTPPSTPTASLRPLPESRRQAVRAQRQPDHAVALALKDALALREISVTGPAKMVRTLRTRSGISTDDVNYLVAVVDPVSHKPAWLLYLKSNTNTYYRVAINGAHPSRCCRAAGLGRRTRRALLSRGARSTHPSRCC